MADKIEITKEEYYKLKSSSLKLQFLEHGGVDNWQNYCDALNPYGEQTFWDLDEELRMEILGR